MRNDFSWSCLSTAWRSFKKHTFGPIRFILHSCCCCNLIINIAVSQGKQDSVFYISLNSIVPGKIIPIKFIFVEIRQENGASMFFKNWDWVLVLLGLFSCSCWHRVCTCWAVGSWIFGSKPSWWFSFLMGRRRQLSNHFFNRCNHQIRISLGEINILLQHEPILIKSVRSFHASYVYCPFCWRSRCSRWINRVINHEWTCITLWITIRRNYLCIWCLRRLLKKFFSNNDEFKRVNILTFNC